LNEPLLEYVPAAWVYGTPQGIGFMRLLKVSPGPGFKSGHCGNHTLELRFHPPFAGLLGAFEAY
jgi:hypothetical protein